MKKKFKLKKVLCLLLILIIILVTVFFSYKFIVAEMTPVTTTESLFVYGTLTSPLIRLYACQCITDESTAVLNGYKKVGLNIVPDLSSKVEGKLLQVTPIELERLDGYENTPHNYKRIEVQLIDGVNAWVYIK
jgi:gamma-glutamylcyclotransferase (GGCT)/AIG2-like uncharacterized protein YtfP